MVSSIHLHRSVPQGANSGGIRKRLAACRSPEHRIDEKNQDEQDESPIYITGAAVLHRSGMLSWKKELHRTTKVSLPRIFTRPDLVNPSRVLVNEH